MTFNLSEAELQSALEAIEHHGYSALLPTPPEWAVMKAEWASLRPEIAKLDLDTYTPVRPLRIYAPKSRATVRVVSLLHPLDLIIYTALTLVIKNDIEMARVPSSKKVVFSYRADTIKNNRLYRTTPTFRDFFDRLDKKSAKAIAKFVAVADIADFYPRIYQHRLENAVESASTSPRSREVARVLVRKLIGNLSGNNSYGIPVGPYASRLLGEVVLADVDSYLMSEGYDFVRWVDDYYFFLPTEQAAQEVLMGLAQRLYEKHGLTLSSSKTKILKRSKFRERFSEDPNDIVDERISLIRGLSERFDPYLEEDVELSPEEIIELTGAGIADLIQDALADEELVDYETVSAILRHPEVLSQLPIESRKQVADKLLENIEHLYPVAAEFSRFFSRFTDYNWRDRKKAKAKLLRSLQPQKGRWPPDYYMLWVLSIFGESDAWRDAPDYAKIFRDHRSDVVRRMAAIAIAKNGTRADALETRDRFEPASRLEQTAILLASHKLGVDERKHWRNSLQLTGILERKL